MKCVICLYAREVAEDAVTIVEGYAVCMDHIGYVAQGETWAWILRTVKPKDGMPIGT